MSEAPIHLEDCWAKTDPTTGEPALTVRDHCLVVGHVASTLMECLPAAVRDALPPGAICLVAAHDIGKITPGFQLKCLSWSHHDAFSSSILKNGLVTQHAYVSTWHLTHAEPFRVPKAAQRWLVSTAGHHGSYPNGWAGPGRECFEGVETANGVHPVFAALRDELLGLLLEAFGPLPTESAKDQEIRAHLLTGFTIFADWIGSNHDWFPPDTPIDAKTIITRTRRILEDRFGYPAQVHPHRSFGQLFSPDQPDSFPPRPLQTALLDAADRPGLYIVEAPMGTGKTEAALAAAYRRWSAGDARGLYFALPTQLTSAKIHERIEAFLAQTLDQPAFQSLIHGNAWLAHDRNRPVGPATEEHNDTDEALRWFSTTRRQLLAPFGTGTIDQALLAVLPARFAALRHFALAGKVVVIDEVHSYDPYMAALIDRLITFLLPTGATVIILSATLTAARRAELVAAAGATEPTAPEAYPLITKVGTGDATAVSIPVTDPTPSKTIHLHHHTHTAQTAEAYWQSIADHITGGANVVVIRNTVALAQETYRHLKNLLSDTIPATATGLLHSRFTQARRLENEDLWIRRLGKDSAHRPAGSLLVATQIVEQSVDIDADLLVTDLAPVELILQRIGRLHRHDHPRPAGLDAPHCHILHPPAGWRATAKEIEADLAPHHFIYPPLALWQASEILRPLRTITLPTQIRPLLEDAARTRPDPAVLQAFDQFLSGDERKRLDQQGTAKTRHVFAQAIDDKEGRETRWRIQDTAHLILVTARPEVRNGRILIHPLHGEPVEAPAGFFSYPLARALHHNAIRIPTYLIRNALGSSQDDWLRQHLPDALIGIVRRDTVELELHTNAPVGYSFEHTNRLGLTWKKSAQDLPIPTEPEDFWF